MSEFREKIRSVGFSTRKGSSRDRPVRHDHTGHVVGKQTDHWDGRVDATAFAPTIRIRTESKEER